MLILLFLLNKLDTTTFLYHYTTNITENSYKEILLETFKSDIYITPIKLINLELHNQTLWYLTMNINDEQLIKQMNCLILFNKNGLIQEIYIDKLINNMNIINLNLLKGIISLFNIHKQYESGIEIDSSGQCYVTYAIINNSINYNNNVIIIDKEKKFCKRLSYPIDIWNKNLIKINNNLKETRNILIRYTYNALNYQINEIKSYEKQIHSIINITNNDNDDNDDDYINEQYKQLINTTGIELITWQILTYKQQLNEYKDNEKIEKLLIKYSNSTLHQIIELLLSPNYQTMHLGLSYPIMKLQSSCSLNNNLFTDNDNNINNETDYNNKLIKLRHFIESYRDFLQNDVIGTMKSSEAVLHLINELRCLSNTNQSINLLTNAIGLTPPIIEANLIYRQFNTWKDNLIDILINCGTNTCLTIVFNRLNVLIEFIYTNNTTIDKHSLEVVKTKEMLFTKLWPSISHIHYLSIDQLIELYQYCEKSIIIDQNYICLMSLVNLYSRFPNYHINDSFKQIIKYIQQLLDISLINSNKKSINIKRHQLLIGLSMTKLLRHNLLTRSLMKIILHSESIIPSIIRTIAINVLNEIYFSESTKNQLKSINQSINQSMIIHNEQIKSEIRTRLIEMLYKLCNQSINNNNNNDDLLIGHEIFKLLIQSELSSKDIAYILYNLSKQYKWSLIQLCRQFIKQWCKLNVLTIVECHCLGDATTINTLKSTICQLGLAGSWPSLIGEQSTAKHYTNRGILLQNDLYNLYNQLIIDYTSYYVIDMQGGLQLSDFTINLISNEGESQLFNLNIQANALTSLGSSSSSISSNNKKHQTSINDYDETWLSYNVNYFGISLLPNEIFSGGITNILSILWSLSSQLTPFLQCITLPIDQRNQFTLSSGWIIQIDNLGIITLSLSNAIDTNIWKLSGRSNTRTQLNFIYNMKLHLIQLKQSNVNSLHNFNSSVITKGIALQGYIDFIINININNLPDSICLSMNQGDNTYFIQWYLTNNSIFNQSLIHDKNNQSYNYVTNYTIQPISYNLGYENSLKCKMMQSKTLW
ncbi:Microsomal triglyceride transfer protein large subunit [Schistosoma japonicum]|nr:Microsomal triglyceride transfer protein large subunit [Schistosoma japonicum]